MIRFEFQLPDMDASYNASFHACQKDDFIDITDELCSDGHFTVKKCSVCKRIYITVHSESGPDKTIDMRDTPLDLITALDLHSMNAEDIQRLSDRFTDDVKQTIFSNDYKKARFWFAFTDLSLIFLIIEWFLITFCRYDEGSSFFILLTFFFGSIVATYYLISMLSLKIYVRKKGTPSPFPISFIASSDGKVTVKPSDKDMFYLEVPNVFSEYKGP